MSAPTVAILPPFAQPDEPATGPAEIAGDDQDCGLYWVAVFLIDLSYGGPEEGGWWYQAGTLVIDPWVYETLGAAPAGFCSRDAADAHAALMRTRLSELNRGRPEISQTNSVGQYDILVMRALTMPTHFPRTRPSYA